MLRSFINQLSETISILHVSIYTGYFEFLKVFQWRLQVPCCSVKVANLYNHGAAMYNVPKLYSVMNKCDRQKNGVLLQSAQREIGVYFFLKTH